MRNQPHELRRVRRSLTVLLFVALLCLSTSIGCASGSPAGKTTGDTSAADAAEQSVTKPFSNSDTRIRFQFAHIRTVEYDGFALPILSPDGCWAAVQISSAADWPTLLASVDGGVPDAGRIAIAPLCADASTPLLAVLGNDLLIGRSCDSEGFLVESPRLDGARWIGKVNWQGGEPTWIVADEDVNAFASLGPAGEIAWCHRRRDVEKFSILVKRGDVIQEIPPPQDGSWLAPSFSSDGKFLYALRLRDGVLAACAFPISQTISMTPIIFIDLSWRADARMAYQTVIPLRTGGDSSDQRLYFFHPRFSRMAIWNPLNNRIALTSPSCSSAMAISSTQIVTSSAKQLSVESAPVEGGAKNATQSTAIIESLWIPIGRGTGSVILVVQPGRSTLNIARIDLDPPEK
jgi:hypothetical protein